MGFVKLSELPKLEIAEGIRGHAVTAENVTVFHAELDAGALLPAHNHVHEQVVNVIEGELELVVDGVTHHLVPGTAMVLPSNVVHSGRAVTKCRVVDVFQPVREDFAGKSFGGYPDQD